MTPQETQRAINVLTLSIEQLSQMRDEVAADIAQGLAQENQAIKALPSYVRVPTNTICGEAVVLDAGGTNIRAAHVKLNRQSVSFINEPQADRTLMSEAQAIGAISREVFFTRQAALIQKVCPDEKFNLGYCFSYPSENQPNGDASLVSWTKGINIDNMIGASLRQNLTQALDKQKQTALKTPVLNDTITTLIAGAWMDSECDQYIALIAGTGMNAAAFYKTKQISKLSAIDNANWDDDEFMGVNLELGNFSPSCLSKYDDELDEEGVNDHPSKQRLEKAIAGKYTASLFGRIVGCDACLALPDAWAFDPEAGSRTHAGHVTQLRRYQGSMAAVATALINRGADLTAAALAGVVQSQNLDPNKAHTVGILAEGTLFWQTEGYRERVEAILNQLTPKHISIKILQNTSNVDANFIGAACAALL